ncbi:MAG TPA: protein translocase subunit SecD, partial [Candidatus Eisenbacteria bacterium]|nr:protein translocase subunit SecD [Candidatus Eisenbacteria bacterium]
MKQNNIFRLLLVVFITAWSVSEMWPPMSRDPIQMFAELSEGKPDANFLAIIESAKKLQAGQPQRGFANLRDAVGTNDLAKYFPSNRIPAGADTNRAILNAIQHKSAGRIKLGLDLQGGTEYLVTLETNRLNTASDKKALIDQAVEVLRKRVDKLGVAEPLIQPSGDDRIVIQMPGLSEVDKESAVKQIKAAAFLEFRMVHPESDELVAQGLTAPGYEVLKEKRKDKDSGKESERSYLVKIEPEQGLTGKYIKRAYASRNTMSNEPEIDFELNPEGAEIFARITREFSPVGNRYYMLGIVLDGELKTAPRLLGEIPAGRGQITGSFDFREASDIATALENPLEAPVRLLSERSVDPSLGKDSIESGIRASIYGTLAVSIFMLIYYRLSGFVANIALILNLVILVGVMASVGTTLTLPGIAGIVLTVGMAVDANVLIYERIREELAKGKSLRGALSAGYDRAFGTIFDSHVTTLISSIILIVKGTGSIKGFGVALTIGVAASLFTALVVTRLIFDFLLSRNMIKGLPMMHMIKATKLDFMAVAKPAFILSWT